MRWTPGGPSSDLEDRRGSSGGFGGGGMRIGLGGAAVLLVLSLIFKQNFFALLSGDGAAGTPSASGPVEALRARQAGALPGCHPVGLRLRADRERAVLLSWGREGLYRPRLLRRAAAAIRRARRFRPGLRAGPR